LIADRRRDRPRDHQREALAAGAAGRGQDRVDLGLRVLPGDGLGRAALTPLEGDLRALTVVEAEDRALGPDVGRPLRGDVLRVALDLDRPAVLRLGEDAVDGAALLEGGR